jgi:HAD superfamily hydrolase (TIGR01549 family)
MILVFDLDDTLIDATHYYQRVIEKMLSADEKLAYGKARIELKTQMSESSTSRHNRLIFFKRMLEILNRFSVTNLFEFSDRYEAELQALIKNLLQFLTELKKAHQLAIITNENLRTQMVKIQGFDPNHQVFDHILVSEEFGEPKPKLDMFKRLSLRYAGRKAQDFLMIGDSLKNDIFPAQQMGWKTLWTQEYHRENDSVIAQHKEFIGDKFREPDFVVQQLFDLKKYL